MASWLSNMNLWLGFSPKATQLLIREQGLDNPDRLPILTDQNVFDICNVMRKQGGKNTNRMLGRGQQIPVIAQAKS